ncbi:MAG: sugar ABC transporter ATP-binding protein [Synergistaceae bacterium]|jgi:ribose transport system ATP-binding protein|nr:sugar ABC transporter ATP-binding protein [Synergistaceae bacterium]
MNIDLRMENISIFFGEFQALSDVGIDVKSGEIHGLLGENGAGKSTLMNILAGIYSPSSGRIIIDGETIHNMTVTKAADLGIRFIHQELSVIEDLRVYENLFLSKELTLKNGFLDKHEMISRSTTLMSRMNLDIDVGDYIRDLDTSRKQLVEIAKAIMFEARLIIMDEPTTSLTNKEIEILFDLMRNLKKSGVSMIYISHKMPELFSVCDKYTVLRDGKFIQSGEFRTIDEHGMTELMVGRSVVESERLAVTKTDEVVFEVNGLSCGDFFRDISFSLHKGEVLALTGLFGDGRAELSEALFGARKVTSGTIKKFGARLPLHDIGSVMRAGVGMVPRSRKERSIFPDLSILNNASMAYLAKNRGSFFADRRDDLRRFGEMVKLMNVRYDHEDNFITSLSGGNQQKVVLARWLEIDADVYILDNPTQGIDVGAKFEVYKLINLLTSQGKSVIIFSSEFPEIYRVCDRCAIMYKGVINAVLDRSELTEIKMMYYSTGANLEAGTRERAN